MFLRRTRLAFVLLAALCSACGADLANTYPSATPELRLVKTGTPPAKSTTTPSPTLGSPTPSETLVSPPFEFTENFNGNLPYWQFLQVNNSNPPIDPMARAGFLVFDLSAPNQWVYGLYAPQEYSDIRVEARVETRAGALGATGVICRYSEKNGWYELNVYGDQTYMLLYGQWLAEGVARYTPLVRAKSEKIQAGGNEIGLLCNGTTLTPFINGVQLRQIPEKMFGLDKGKIGISASSFENTPMTIAYDWVKVSKP